MMSHIIIFRCTCDWSWVVNFRDAIVVGPIYATVVDGEAVMSTLKAMSWTAWEDLYGDCVGDFTRRFEPQGRPG